MCPVETPYLPKTSQGRPQLFACEAALMCLDTIQFMRYQKRISVRML